MFYSYYEVKRGKYTSVKGARQKRFIRFKTLGAGYSEDELQAVIAGKTEHRPRQTQPVSYTHLDVYKRQGWDR